MQIQTPYKLEPHKSPYYITTDENSDSIEPSSANLEVTDLPNNRRILGKSGSVFSSRYYVVDLKTQGVFTKNAGYRVDTFDRYL